MVRAFSSGLALLMVTCLGCQGKPGPNPDPQDPEPRLRLTGMTIKSVIHSLGDPEEVAEAQYFGTKFSDGPLAVVFKYSKEQLYVYINGKGVVLGVAKGSTKNFIKW